MGDDEIDFVAEVDGCWEYCSGGELVASDGEWRCSTCLNPYALNISGNLEHGTIVPTRALGLLLAHVKQVDAADQDANLVAQGADYIRSEAERLPNGTAARFLAALDAMDGATDVSNYEVHEMTPEYVKSLDSDKDVTSGLHAHSKRLEHSVSDIDVFRATRNTTKSASVSTGLVDQPDTLGQRDVTQSDLRAGSVTITISREAAEDLAERAGQWAVVTKPFADACRAALEGGES